MTDRPGTGPGENGPPGPTGKYVTYADNALFPTIGNNAIVTNNLYISPLPELAWPVRLGQLPELAGFAQPRPDLQRQIAEGLADRGAVILCGDGGRGKTQTAVTYCDHAIECGVDLVLWVGCSSPTDVITGFAQAANRLRVTVGTDPVANAQALRNWLATTDRSWLIAIDDFAPGVDLTGLWPPTRPQGKHLLVTTRRRDAALTSHGTRVDVDVFTPGQACAYLHQRLADTRPGTLDQADALAADLGYLPLALAGAAAVVADHAWTIGEYRGLLADTRTRLDKLFPDTATGHGDFYQTTVDAVWNIALRAADSRTPERLAALNAQLISVLDSTGLPANILATSAARDYLSAQTGGPVDSDDVARAIRNLHLLSVITHDPSTPHRAIRMHALAQRATIQHLPDQQITGIIRTVADALMQAWPNIENDPGLAQTLRSNTITLASHHQCAAALITDHAHPILSRACASFAGAGLPREAIAMGEPIRDAMAVHLGADHRDTLALRNSLAEWKGQAGDPTTAASSLRDLLEIEIKVLGRDDPQTLSTQHALANWQGWSGDPIGAVSSYQQLLDVMPLVLGPDHTEVLATRHDLARWRGSAGDALGAYSAYNELLRHQLRVLGADQARTFETRGNLAYWRGMLGEATAAIADYKSLLDDMTRVLGPDHLQTLTTRQNWARWIGESGDAAAAATAFSDLLGDMLRVLGTDHPQTLTARHNLAYWTGELGDPVAAVLAYEALLADSLRVLGPDHPHTLTARHNLARWVGEAGDPIAAICAFHGVLSDRLRVLGPDHPHTLTTRQRLANCLGEAENFAAAVKAYKVLLPDMLRVLGPDHPHTLTARHNLARWIGEAGNPVAAIAAYQDLLADMLRVLGHEHPRTREAEQGLNRWLSLP